MTTLTDRDASMTVVETTEGTKKKRSEEEGIGTWNNPFGRGSNYRERRRKTILERNLCVQDGCPGPVARYL